MQIRTRRISMFLGLLDPDRYIIMQNVRKTLKPTVL
jgi:hypothetical protein